MIKKLKLKFGAAIGVPAEEINITPMTVFVGPNNSGKSKLLSEISGYCNLGVNHGEVEILDQMSFAPLNVEEVERAISKAIRKPRHDETIVENHVFIESQGRRYLVPLCSLRAALLDPSSAPQHFCAWYLATHTLYLGGGNRITLLNSSNAGDLQQEAKTSLQTLFRDDEKRHEVRRIVAEAFGSHFVIDPTNMGSLRVCWSANPPIDDREERGFHAEAVDFHSKGKPVNDVSDGMKAFTGIIAEVIAGDPRVILIDEPEAFLHPSLASRLGHELSRAAQSAGKNVLVSTHSAAFVMGCIQSGTPISIVRLTYKNEVATARVLPSDEIIQLMRNPLLRSTGVLNGLFYEFVVVTEADTDRAFYQEINERLLKYKPEWGIPNCLFVNAQNKQTVRIIVQPLRQLGIPAAGIVDIDIVKDGGNVWTNLLKSAGVPDMLHQSFATTRIAVKQAMEASGKDMKRDGGISILEKKDKEAAQNLLDQLESYGIFVVPGGELECWLKQLGATSDGATWLVSIFERMGENPDSPDYLKPAENDVWQFLSHLKEWFADQNRKGIPT